jgi:glycosyltransferase involved in cell wall biosynthesis
MILKGFALASEKEPSLRLLLLGNGSLAEKIHGLVHALHLKEKIHFGGRIGQDALPRYYHAADLYLSASHSDGSSVSLMEALACGLPVIVSDIPGNREWIGDGKAGWMFPDGDAEALAQSILNALKDQKILVEKRTQARLLAETKADWNRNFPILLQGYEMAIKEKGNR